MEAGLPNPWVLGGDLPDLDTLPAVRSSHSDTLESNLPMLDALPAVGSSHLDQPEKKAGMPFNDLPLLPDLCCNGSNDLPLLPEFSCNGSEGSHVKPAVGGKKKAAVKDQPLVAEPINGLPLLPEFSCNGSNDLPLLPGFSCDGSEGRHVKPAVGGKEITDLPSLPEGSRMEPVVGGKHKRRFDKNKLPGALASPSIPWRRLPYLRWEAMADIRVVADIYGNVRSPCPADCGALALSRRPRFTRAALARHEANRS